MMFQIRYSMPEVMIGPNALVCLLPNMIFEFA